MNSLILASLNGVKNIIFPFIGGEIFFKKLVSVELAAGRVHNKKEHAKMLLKGVTDFYEFMKDNKMTSTLKRIYFCPWGKEEVDALYSAMSYASSSSGIKKIIDIDSVISILGGKSNLIDETMNLAKGSSSVVIDAIVNAANVELDFGSGVSSMCYAAIGKDDTKQQKLYKIKKQFCDAFKKYIKQKNDDTLQASSIATVAEKIRNDALLAMGVPKGYVETSGDTYEVGIQEGEGNIIVNKRIDDLKLNNFENPKDSGKFIHGIPAGSSLFYYDIKPKYSGSKNNYIKCWFSFNTSTFRAGFDNTNSNYKLQVYNPLGSEGMIVWLDTSSTAKKWTPFGENDKKEIKKAIDSSRSISQTETSYIDTVKYYINMVLDSYKNKSFYLRDEIKNKIIELAKQINMPVPDGITSWDDIKGWTADYIKPASAASDAVSSESVSPVPPVPSSKKQPPNITQINNIKKRATVGDFIKAQEKGVNVGEKIPGGLHDKIVYSVNGSNVDTALQEISDRKKETHWMWYIFPSDLPTSSSCATFFRIGPSAMNDKLGKDTITISDYLKDKKLMKNYMTITEALYDKLDDIMSDEDDDDDNGDETPQKILRKIMNSDDDYSKLKKSIENFYNPLKTKINSNSNVGLSVSDSEFIKKMNILNTILNDICDPDSDYDIEDEMMDQIQNGYFKMLEEDIEEEKEEEEEKEKSPSLLDDSHKEEVSSATIGVETENVDVLEPKLNLKTNTKSRILSLEEILKLIILNIRNNVFIINGGSFNPPHNGHIKMFELAYNNLVSKKEESSSGTSDTGYYGIMVVSTRQHILGKNINENEILNSGDRINLCKLACDEYNWGSENFNSSNILILNYPEYNPIKQIISKVQSILDTSKKFQNEKELLDKIKMNNLFYLCGSDFFMNWYSISSRYSVICVSRQLENDEVQIKINELDKSNNLYLKKLVLTENSDEYDLSSSIVRNKIKSLSNSKTDKEKLEIQNSIISLIGLPVYCYLANINYSVNKNLYGG